MLQTKQFLAELKKHFRLNIYEVKIWTSLLSRGQASASELADISGVPRSRCYDVLESLEKKGFIIMKIGKPIKYLAVKPEVILERVKKNIQDEADLLEQQMENIRDTSEFKDLEMLHKTGVQHVDISTISKSIVGRVNINRFMKSMILKAKSKIIFVVTNQHLERAVKVMKNFMPEFEKKRIKVKLYSPFNKSVLRKLQNIEHVEYESSSSFLTVDGNEMFFMVSTDSAAPDYEVGVWIKSSFFVNSIDILFESNKK
jgi:sugar-specific transcriptional regulator TrmB